MKGVSCALDNRVLLPNATLVYARIDGKKIGLFVVMEQVVFMLGGTPVNRKSFEARPKTGRGLMV
jgi:hypothetical protein